jgi:hypothetical protein
MTGLFTARKKRILPDVRRCPAVRQPRKGIARFFAKAPTKPPPFSERGIAQI